MDSSLNVSALGRRYGRIAPPPLPRHMMLNRTAAVALPQTVDLRKSAGPIKDQGDEGSCTGHAFSSAREWIARAYGKSAPILSPQFLYASALIAQGDFPNDDGSDGETLCETLIANGCCLESDYPYVAGQIERPTPAQLASARRYKLGAYHGLTGSYTALTVLGDKVPWPVGVGFNVFESFESDEVAKTGIMPIPGPGEKSLGGHQVLMLGYDMPKRLALIQNSWGTGWAQSGFFWMPFEVLDRPDTDLKIVHPGRPW